MSFAAEIKGFVNGMKTGFSMGEKIKDRQLKEKTLEQQNKQFNAKMRGVDTDTAAGIDRIAAGAGGADSGGDGSGGSQATLQAGRERYDFLVNELGYPPAAAAGIVGNAAHESAGFDPNVTGFKRRGDQGSAYGEFQWRGDRVKGLMEFAKANQLDPADWKTQYRYMDHEQKTLYPDSYKAVMSAKTPDEAASAFAMHFERPAGSETGDASKISGIGDRVSWANRIASFQPTTATTTPVPAVRAQAVATTDQPEPEPVEPTTEMPTDSDDSTALDDEENQGFEYGGAVRPEALQGFADGGTVDKYGRGYTQDPGGPGAAVQPPASTWVPRRVGEAPATGLTPIPTGGYADKFRQMVADRNKKAAAPPPAAAAPPDLSHQAYLEAQGNFLYGPRGPQTAHAPPLMMARGATDHGNTSAEIRTNYDMQHAQRPQFMSELDWQRSQPGYDAWYQTQFGRPAPTLSPGAQQRQAQNAALAKMGRPPIGFARGGMVEEADDGADSEPDSDTDDRDVLGYADGGPVSATDYDTLDPGNESTIREGTSALWRLDAQNAKQKKGNIEEDAAKRITERDKAYSEMKPPKAKPLIEQKADAAVPTEEAALHQPATGNVTPSPAPAAPPTAAIPEMAGPELAAAQAGPDPSAGNPPGVGNTPVVAPGWDQVRQMPVATAEATVPHVQSGVGPTPSGPPNNPFAPPGAQPPSVPNVSPEQLAAGLPIQPGPAPGTPGPGQPQITAPPPPEAVPGMASGAVPTPPERPPEAAPVPQGPPAVPADRTIKPKYEPRPQLVSPEERQKVADVALKTIQAETQGPRQSAVGGGPSIDPAKGVDFATNQGALSHAEYQEVTSHVDPEGKLTDAERQLKAQHDMFDYYLARGYPQQAAKIAAGMAMYSRKVSQAAGAMAQAAIEKGDLTAAGNWMAKAYDNVGNGQELHLGAIKSEDGQPAIQYQLVDSHTGKVVENGLATAEEMNGMAQKMSSGQAWLSETIKVAQGTGLLKGGKGGAERAPTSVEVQRGPEAVQSLQAANEAAAAYQNDPTPENKKKANAAIGAALTAGADKGALREMRSNYGLMPQPASRLSAPERKQQATEEANTAALDKEQDPVKKRLIMADQGFAKQVEATKWKPTDASGEMINAEIQKQLGENADPAAIATHRAVALQLLRGGAAQLPEDAVTIAKTLYDPATKISANPDGSISFEGGAPIFLPQSTLRIIQQHRAAAKQPEPAA